MDAAAMTKYVPRQPMIRHLLVAVLAGVVTGFRHLDLDHPGTQLGQQQRAIGPGENARQIDDRDAGKRPSLWHAGNPSGAGDVRSIAQSGRRRQSGCAHQPGADAGGVRVPAGR